MRWFFVGVMAALLGLAVGGAAQACGCCCQGKCGGGACPSCPGPGPAGGGACPNCPRSAASFTPSRYWDSAYRCYLYYDEGTRSSYYWSEAHRAYYPVASPSPGGTAAPAAGRPTGDLAPGRGSVGSPGSPALYRTQYHNP